MAKHKIALIPGDGIGKEVVPEGMRVLEAAARRSASSCECTDFDWSCERYAKTGEMMPEDGLEQLKAFDAIFLGAVGWPGVPDHVSLWGLLIPIRRGFQQYVNLRPVRLFEGVTSPLADRKPGEIDFWIVRENNEGEYSEIGGRMFEGTDNEMAVQEAVFTRKAATACMRYAFELARRRARSTSPRPPSRTASSIRCRSGTSASPRWQKKYPGRQDRPVPHRHPDRAFRAQPAIGSTSWSAPTCSATSSPTSGRRVTGSIGIAPSAQHQPGARVPLDVRAGAWLGAGHRRQGHRQSDRPDLVGRDDAASISASPRRPRPSSAPLRRHWSKAGHAPRISAATATPRPWAPPSQSL